MAHSIDSGSRAGLGRCWALPTASGPHCDHENDCVCASAAVEFCHSREPTLHSDKITIVDRQPRQCCPTALQRSGAARPRVSDTDEMEFGDFVRASLGRRAHWRSSQVGTGTAENNSNLKHMRIKTSCTHAHMCARTRTHTHTYTCPHMHTHMHPHALAHTCMLTDAYTLTQVPT